MGVNWYAGEWVMKNRLPIGTQSFDTIRVEGYKYVDKTGLAWNLANSLRMAFLSRPRRFGKSLLVSTLDAYFSGRKELFEGLAAGELEDAWQHYPVIRVDFSKRDYGIDGNFSDAVDSIICEHEEKYGVEAGSGANSRRFESLIRSLHRKFSKKVVVLVDEYDKPILDALYEPHEDMNRKLLRDFYSPLKACDEHLRFVFLTGITKISHVNIFSGLNQLQDISLSDKYSSVCGLTEQEVRLKGTSKSLRVRTCQTPFRP